jgi:hypothetical protein
VVQSEVGQQKGKEEIGLDKTDHGCNEPFAEMMKKEQGQGGKKDRLHPVDVQKDPNRIIYGQYEKSSCKGGNNQNFQT